MPRADDPWLTLLDQGWAKACAETGFRSEDQCAAVQRGRELGAVSVEAAFRALIAANDGKNASHDLLRWYALLMLDRLPGELRLEVLRSVGESDPPTAALIYCTRADLTDAEDEVLKAIFMPSMSVMREKVMSGTLKRAKARG